MVSDALSAAGHCLRLDSGGGRSYARWQRLAGLVRGRRRTPGNHPQNTAAVVLPWARARPGVGDVECPAAIRAPAGCRNDLHLPDAPRSAPDTGRCESLALEPEIRLSTTKRAETSTSVSPGRLGADRAVTALGCGTITFFSRRAELIDSVLAAGRIGRCVVSSAIARPHKSPHVDIGSAPHVGGVSHSVVATSAGSPGVVRGVFWNGSRSLRGARDHLAHLADRCSS